jgi:hypothetical protein
VAALPLILRGTRRAVLALSHRALPRLTADNLIRAQSRVILTILTLSLALLMITAITGVTSFSLNVAMKQAMGQRRPGVGSLSPCRRWGRGRP